MAVASAPSLHVVVLAAGRGSRLGALGEETPKWLLDIGGQTLADRHLEGVDRADGRVAHSLVVTGHAAGAIDGFLAGRPGDQPGTLHNEDFERRNNWYSVLLALRAVPDPTARVVVINADLLAPPEVIAAFLGDAAATDADALLAVDLDKPLTDESMKVSLRAGDQLDRIGKVGVPDPVGEYVGLLMARGAALRALRAALEAFERRPDAADEWYERAVGETAAAGQAWTAWRMPAQGWIEIDDDADVAAAQELAAGWDGAR